MVEVDASKELVTAVEVRLPTGVVYHQSVVFEFIPKYCKKCKIFEHAEGDCKKESMGRKVSAYVPKRKLQTGGGTAINKAGAVGVKGGARELIGEPILDENPPVKTTDHLADIGQPGPCGQAPGCSEVPVDKSVALEPAVSEDLADLVAPPAPAPTCPAVDMAPRVRGGFDRVTRGSKGKLLDSRMLLLFSSGRWIV